MNATSNDGLKKENAGSPGAPVPFDMNIQELHQRLEGAGDIFLLDVREPQEYRIANIGGLLIPLGQLPGRLGELERPWEIAVICHHGNRSRRAVEYLRENGFSRARNVTGGIDAWSRLIDPGIPLY